MKDCTQCGKRKELSDFSVNRANDDGLSNWCRDCTSAYQKARRERANANRPEGWKQKTKDKAEYMRAWKEANPGKMTEYKRDWWQRNRERLLVKEKVRYAVRSGKLQRLPCGVCGEVEVEAHHPDYDKPLDVIWLCRKHHMEIHNAT